METWIRQILSSEQAPALTLVAAMLMGILSVFTCACNYAILGMVAGYSGADAASGRTGRVIGKGVAFLAGTVISMSLIGGLFGYAGGWLSEALGSYWKVAAGLIAIFFGLYSMDLLPFRVPGFSVKATPEKQSLFAAILFGFVVGGLSSACNTCCNPFFPIILAATFVKGSAAWGVTLLAFFSLGFGLPLAAMIFGIGFGMEKIGKGLARVVSFMKYAGGGILVVLGFYLLFTL